MSHRKQDAFERAIQQFWALGGVTTNEPAGTLVTHEEAPTFRMGNFACEIRTDDLDAVDALVGQTKRVLIDRLTPPVLAAHLTLHDWRLEHELQLVLPPDHDVPVSTGVTMTSVQEDDWKTIYDFFRIDHEEEDARAKVETRPEVITRAGVDLRRSVGTEATYYLASTGSEPEACIATWGNDDGIGIIEDVFVHPEARGRHIATNMLRFAVESLRRDGIDQVLIATDVADTPKHLYARFGFRPVFVRHSYNR